MQASAQTSESLPQVIIVGGGFGGLSAAKELAGKAVRVTLIDRTNHHLFQPLLYQVATAGLSPADIAQPILHILRDAKNIEVMLGEVDRIDCDAKQVRTTDNVGYLYDYSPEILLTGLPIVFAQGDQLDPGAARRSRGLCSRGGGTSDRILSGMCRELRSR